MQKLQLKINYNTRIHHHVFSTFKNQWNVDFATTNPSKHILPCHAPNSVWPKKKIFRRDAISETDPVHGSSSKLSLSSFFNKSSICSLEEIDYLLLYLLFYFLKVYSSLQKTRKCFITKRAVFVTNSELIEMASTYENITTVHILVLTTSEDIKQHYLHYFLNKLFLIFRNCYRALCGIRRNEWQRSCTIGLRPFFIILFP